MKIQIVLPPIFGHIIFFNMRHKVPLAVKKQVLELLQSDQSVQSVSKHYRIGEHPDKHVSLCKQIECVYRKHKGRYGYRRVFCITRKYYKSIELKDINLAFLLWFFPFLINFALAI